MTTPHKVSLPTIVSEICSTYQGAQKEEDKYIDGVLRNFRFENKPISCDTCSKPYCCYQKITEPLAAGLPVAAYLRATRQDTPELRERLKNAGEAMEAHTSAEWMHQNRQPCVFLKDDKCSVYPIRPINCRSYHVISPQSDCSYESETMVEAVDFENLIGMEIEMAQEFHRALGIIDSKERIHFGAFPRMVYLCLKMLEASKPLEVLVGETMPSIETLENILKEEPFSPGPSPEPTSETAAPETLSAPEEKIQASSEPRR